jgi:hypothetical protein
MTRRRVGTLPSDSEVRRPQPALAPNLVVTLVPVPVPVPVLVSAPVVGPMQHTEVAVVAMPSSLAGGSAWLQQWQKMVAPAQMLAHHARKVLVYRTERPSWRRAAAASMPTRVPVLMAVTEMRTERLLARVRPQVYRWPRAAQGAQAAEVERTGLARGQSVAEEALQLQSSTTVAVVAVRQQLLVLHWVQ